MNRISVHRGDITRLDVEAIVNAANSSLLGGGGVDGAIHRAAGPELVHACRQLGGCPPGQARITPGFALAARWVIHTVGPVWQGGDAGEDATLAECYGNSLRLAVECGALSIAFPAISCGIYRFPPQRAAAIAVRALSAFAQRSPQPGQLILCAFDASMAELYRAELEPPSTP